MGRAGIYRYILMALLEEAAMRRRRKKPERVGETVVVPAPAPDAPPPVAKAKLFMNGRSQAVRLPRAYRFDGAEVAIRREGDAVILEPLPAAEWPKGYWERIGRVSADFFAGVNRLRGGLRDVDFGER